MPADIRINEVTTDVNVTDAGAMLTPQVLERIVQAVIQRLETRKREDAEASEDRDLGGARAR